MATAITGLRKVQIGIETVRGDAVAATAKLRGVMEITENHDAHEPEEELGRTAGPERSEIVGLAVEGSFKGDLTFQQVMYWLEMLKGAVAPSGVTPKVWTFTPSFTASNAPGTFTIEAGNDVGAYELEYCLLKRLNISGKERGPVEITAEFFARQKTVAAFTAALSDATVETAKFQGSKFYIDESGAGIGGTQKTGMLKAFNIDIETGYERNWYADGTLYFTDFAENGPRISADFTLAFNTDAEAERVKALARTKRFVRVEISGTTNHKVNIDLCGRWAYPYGWFTTQNGQEQVKVKLKGVYDATWTKMFEVIVNNTLSTLP